MATDDPSCSGDSESLDPEVAQTERLAAMGRLVSGMAHELNNPLASILTTAEILAAYGGAPEVNEMARNIVKETKRCRRLIRQMLGFAREQPANRGLLDLESIVTGALDLQAYNIRMAQVEVERVNRSGGITVLGEPGQLQQVVLNLVENALTALETSDPPRRLTMETGVHGRWAELLVRDNGPGIARERRGQVFDPFFTTGPPGQGTGLGLSISQRITENHDGRIELRPPPDGGGACFRVRLPAQESIGPVSAMDSTGTIREIHRRHFNLLVVDDDRGVLDGICALLRDYGHEVRSATSAAETRAALQASDGFDAILLDLSLPGESGRDLYETLEEGVRERVVFVTGELARQSSAEFLERFAGRTLIKPYTYRELRAALANVLST